MAHIQPTKLFPDHYDTRAHGKVHIYRDFMYDHLVFEYECDGLKVMVDPGKYNNSRARIFDEVMSTRYSVDKFGIHWYQLYQQLCPSL